MKTSANGRKFIGGWEGLRLRTYLDIIGKPTVGYGHLRAPGDGLEAITVAQADDLLAHDLATAEAAVDALGVTLSQNAFDALVSFVFNLGPGILHKGHTLADALRAGDLDAAARAFVLYDHAGGVENQGLRNRRLAEAELFSREDECPPTDPGA